MPDECIEVAIGAALIARDAYATLDVDRLLARFDEMAAPLLARDVASLSPEQQADAISRRLYEQLGFRGNEQDYYDPKNSLLPDVLDRKLGRNTARGRTSRDQVTCFLNPLGIGYQFAAVGAVIYRRAREQGRGTELPTDWFTETEVP